MQQSIIDTIRRITHDKQQRGITPAVATRAEIMAEVQEEVAETLRLLYRQGAIDYIETLNSYAVKLKHTHTTNAKEK